MAKKQNMEKQPVKVVAKELGVAKAAIKTLITNDVIDYKLVNGHYHIDIEEVREALNNKDKAIKALNNKAKAKKKRVTIFTVNMNNSATIIADLQTLASYGRTALEGLGSFDGPLQMAEVAKSNGFIIDNGAIISKDLAPIFYAEMRAGTASESSPGAMELQTAVFNRIHQDWGIWVSQAENKGIAIGFHLADLYFASTCINALE